MKLNLKIMILVAGISMLAASCKQKSAADENLAPNVHKAKAEEVIQTSNYSYILVSEDDKQSWIAITKQEVEKGKFYYYIPGLEMNNFESKELKRTFPSIFFVDKFSAQPITMGKINPADSLKGKQIPSPRTDIKIEPIEGGVTIADLYKGKDGFAGKEVKVKGEVVKFSADIMGRNWIHIQDGTKDGESFDLTITTNDVTKVGDVITVVGAVSVKKDFGAGYFYEVIVENAKILQ
jgi:translation initiation factor 1 (eIF-1/SUI1)